MGSRGEEEIHMKPAALIALLLALFGGNMAITSQWTRPESVRPDPFTGHDAERLRVDLQRQIDEHSRRIEAIRGDVNLCLQIHMGDKRIAADDGQAIARR
jgi:hypothetical protein